MDQNTVIALAVAAVVTPYLTELIKVFAPGDFSGKKSLTVTMIVSILVAIGVLQFEHKLVWTDPAQLVASAGLVLGIASTVYQYMKKAIQEPVEKLSKIVK